MWGPNLFAIGNGNRFHASMNMRNFGLRGLISGGFTPRRMMN
jgi:hypothetical protein